MKEKKIEELAKTFSLHHKNLLIDKRQRLENHKNNYPDSPIPEHFKDDFSISEALVFICEEIQFIYTLAKEIKLIKESIECLTIVMELKEIKKSNQNLNI